MVTKQYLKRKFPGNHAMHELIDFIAPAPFVKNISVQNEDSFTQAAHGFVVGNAIRNNGATWVKAQANNAENAQTFGIVSKVIDEDNFKMKAGGVLPGNWIPGTEYFLSPSTAGLVDVEPEGWSIGEIRQSLGWGTTQGLKIEIDVGDEISVFEFQPDDTVQDLIGTAPLWNVLNGLNARITITGDTLITMGNLATGQCGNLTVTNPATTYNLAFEGYTFKISQSVWKSTNNVYLSGNGYVDEFSWYYDGNVVLINGSLGYL